MNQANQCSRSVGHITVRRAEPGDFDCVLSLVPDLIKFNPPPWRDESQMKKTDLLVVGSALRSMDDDPAVFVADEDGELLGFIHVHSSTDYYTRKQHGHVADLVVRDIARGRGVGTLLLQHAEDWARQSGFPWLTIAVFEDNTHALAVYEHHGFHRETLRLLKTL